MCQLFAGLPPKHSIMGLEARRRRHLLGGAETRLHRAELPRARLLHHDGQPVRHAQLQDGQPPPLLRTLYILPSSTVRDRPLTLGRIARVAL